MRHNIRLLKLKNERLENHISIIHKYYLILLGLSLLIILGQQIYFHEPKVEAKPVSSIEQQVKYDNEILLSKLEVVKETNDKSEDKLSSLPFHLLKEQELK